VLEIELTARELFSCIAWHFKNKNKIKKYLWERWYPIFSFQSFNYPTSTTIINDTTMVSAFCEPLYQICSGNWNFMKQISSQIPVIHYSCGKLLNSAK
jgi:hypothetical protein